MDLYEGILYTGENSIRFLEKDIDPGDFIFKKYNTGKIGVEKKLDINSIEKIADISKKEQTIVFVNTQSKTRRVSENISKGLPRTSNTDSIIDELTLRVESTPSTRILKKGLQNGVAFHHAGLLPIERRIVEDGFENGLIRIITATTTLSAGVNTPAKNVFLLDHETWDRRAIPVRDYKNMAGRAGRIRAKDVFGRSILFGSSEKELEMLWGEYIEAKPEKVESQIPKRQRFDCAILGLFSSGVCSTLEELTMFLTMSFFGHIYYKGTADDFRKLFIKSIEGEISSLIKKGFLEEENDTIIVTELGRICAEELLSTNTILLFYDTIKKCEERITQTKNLDNLTEGIIHLCCCSQDAALLFKPNNRPEIEELKAFWEVNRDIYLYEPKDETQFLRSLRTTRMLIRWIEGLALNELTGYAPHGIVKRTAENISWIVSGLAKVLQKPLFDYPDNVSEFLETLANRVYYGVPSDAIPIMRLRIPAIHRYRASSLAKSGFTSIDNLIEASVSDLTSVSGIDGMLALRIKEYSENFIEDIIIRDREKHLRKAQQLDRKGMIIEQLYQSKGIAFERVCVNILKNELGLDALFIGDVDQHEPDILVRTAEGNIVIECKRKEKRNVTAREAEEILGKGASHSPIANVTIGFPDFVDEAKKNVQNTNITLIKSSILAEILLMYWEDKIDQQEITSLLKSGKYIISLYPSHTMEKLL